MSDVSNMSRAKSLSMSSFDVYACSINLFRAGPVEANESFVGIYIVLYCIRVYIVLYCIRIYIVLYCIRIYIVLYCILLY